MMGGIVTLSKTVEKQSGNDKEHWFSNQGYSLKMPIKLDTDSVAVGKSRIYDQGRFSCALPSTNPNTLLRNNNIYDHIKKMKSTSWLDESKHTSSPSPQMADPKPER